MTFYDGMGLISDGANPTYHFKANSDYDSWLAGDRFCGVDPVNLNVWVMETSGTEEPVNLNLSYTDFADRGTDSIEWKVPKGDIGSLAGKFVDVWTHMIGEPPIWYDASDCNNTGIELNTTSLFCTINSSVNYTSGNIFIDVYDGSNPNTANELGSIYISVSGDYEITGLPIGANVYLFARWDADYNGTKTPGDYLYKTGPITVTENESITVNFESTTMIAGSKGEPYFTFCNVRTFNSSEGIMMALTAKVFDPDGTVPDTINSITVSGPSEFSYSFADEDYYGRNIYWYGTSGQPSEGEYTFTVIDSDGRTAVGHYYFQEGSNIPLPNTSTFQASGDSLTPTLSWGAVSGYEGNLFYRAGIFEVEGENLIPVWRSSEFTTKTVMAVPDGILDGSKSYKWRVGAVDNYIYPVVNNRSVSDKIDLTIDNTMPYFMGPTVYNCQDSDGQFYTAIKATIVDPDGTLPSSIQSLTVKNPSGTTIYTFQPEDYDSILQKYYKKILGRPVDGIYEFTVTDINNNTKTTYDYVKVHDVPLIDANTLQASGDTLTPTLSWGAPTNMDRSLYFRAMVYDNNGNQIWKPERTANTYLDVPSGILQKGVSYLWNVQVFDDKYPVNYSNRSNSNKVDLVIDDTRPYFKWAAQFTSSKLLTGYTRH